MKERRLVDEIKQLLKTQAFEEELQELAKQYLEIHKKATDRLLNCVELIRQGKESVALQEAVISPPLMDLIEALSFAASKEFEERIAKFGMYPPAPFDSNQIAMMGELFEEPIDGNDPLYNDLAHAMRTKDLKKAIQLLRLIAGKNPSDKKASSQLKLTETRVMEGMIDDLVDLAAREKADDFQRSMEEFRQEPWSIAVFEKLEWEGVLAYEEKLRLLDLTERCKAMIESLIESRREEDLHTAEELIERVGTILSGDALDLSEATVGSPERSYEKTLSLCREWAEQTRMELNRKRENSDREANLKTLVRSIMDKEIGKRRDTQDLKDDLASLTSMARDLQEAQQSLEEDDLRNFSQCLSNLRKEIARRQRNFRFLIGAACLTALAVGGFTFHLVSENLTESAQYEVLKNGIANNRNVDELESFLDLFEKSNSERIRLTEFATEIKKGRDRIKQAREVSASYSKRLKEFMSALEGSDDLDSLGKLQSGKRSLHQDLNALNSAHLPMQKDALGRADFAWNEKRDRMQRKISSSIVAMIDEATRFSENEIGLDSNGSTLAANLIRMNKMINGLEAEDKKYFGLQGLGFSASQKSLIESLRKTYELRRQALDSYDLARERLDQANDLEEYLVVLEQIVSSGFVGGALFPHAKKALGSRPGMTDLVARAFLREDFQNWDQFGKKLSKTLVPEQLIDKESMILRTLYQEKRLNEVYRTTLISMKDRSTSFDFQKERWVPVPTELERKHTLAKNVWIHGKKDKVELEVTFQRGGQGKSAGSYLVSQKVNVISGRAATDQIYESEWTGVGPNLEKREDRVRVTGEVYWGGQINPDGPVLTKESDYLFGPDSPIMKTYGEMPKINGLPLALLDSLKGEEIHVFVKAKISKSLFNSMSLRPNEWGLENDPRGKMMISKDFSELDTLTEEFDLVTEWYSYLSRQGNETLQKELEGFFARSSNFSYVRESKFFESFWSQLLDAQFAFRGYVTLDGAWSEEGLANPWGIGSNDLRPVMAQEGKGGVLALGPLFELNCKLDEVLEKARASAGFKSAKDEQYVQIKKNLPYPFDEITEE